MSDLKSQLEKARADFVSNMRRKDEAVTDANNWLNHNHSFSVRQIAEVLSRAAKEQTPYAKDQRLFDLLKDVAVAADHPWLEELTCECGFYGYDTEESGMSVCAKCAINEVLAALKAYVAGEGEK